jgi:hypothetical protein
MDERIPILKLGKALLVTIQVDMHNRLALERTPINRYHTRRP